MSNLFEPSEHTLALVARLKVSPVGAIVTYDELSAAIGSDVRQPKGRGWLYGARTVLLRDDGIVFSPVRGVGLQRLTDHEKVASGQDALRRIRRTARRGDRRVESGLRSNSLTPEDRATGNGYRMVFATIDSVARVRPIRPAAANTEHTEEIDPGRLSALQV